MVLKNKTPTKRRSERGFLSGGGTTATSVGSGEEGGAMVSTVVSMVRTNGDGGGGRGGAGGAGDSVVLAKKVR